MRREFGWAWSWWVLPTAITSNIGGSNELANLVLLCRRHHYRFHEEGWRSWWAADGELVAVPPNID